MKHCPFCAEEIQDRAVLCRFCSRELTIQTSAALDAHNTKNRRSRLISAWTVLLLFAVFVSVVVYQTWRPPSATGSQPREVPVAELKLYVTVDAFGLRLTNDGPTDWNACWVTVTSGGFQRSVAKTLKIGESARVDWTEWRSAVAELVPAEGLVRARDRGVDVACFDSELRIGRNHYAFK